MRHLVIPLLILFTSWSWSAEHSIDKTCDEDNAARLVSLQGSVFFDADSHGHWQVAQLNELICQGSRVRVAPFSRASLRLPSGIVFRLGEGSVLSLNGIGASKPTVLDLLKGFVHFISRTPRQLQINTPIANAGPEGTEFAMRVDDNQVALWVYEGGVRFFNAKGSIRLKPGQGGRTLKGQAPQARIDIKPQDAVNWALYYPPLIPYPDSAMSIDTDIRAAIQHFHQGRIEAALSQLNALASDKHTLYFFKVRAAIRLTIGEVELALQDIQILLANNAHDADALALQSVLALTQNRKDEAYTLAQQAIVAAPHSATAYSALSYAEQGRFELDKALDAAKLAANYAPDDAMVLARLAELELSKGATGDSDKAAQRALALDTNLERTQTVMGFAYLLRTETDNALQRFEKAVSLDSTSPLARLGLGLAKIRNGDLAAGRQDLEIAAILDPNNALLRSYLGKAYYEEKRSTLAEDQFGLAKERDAKDPTPYFYDAILKQTTNRPIEALQDMQKAIELNDNRGVYRSKLLLDDDKAVRSTGLGRIYKELGFDDVARRQATASLAIDPSNYSAHRLLADSYLYRPRQEIARASEVLQAQLLQPLNYNPVQPQLAYTDLNIAKSAGFADTAFNEYSRLFEGNQHHLTGSGLYGSNDTRADEAVLSGVYDKFAYSLGHMHYQTDGFRPNADLKHNLYNAFGQYEFSPQLSVQAEYRYRDTEQGDIRMVGDVTRSDKNFRRNLQQSTYRFGAKYSPTQHSDWLFSYIYADRHEDIKGGQLTKPYNSSVNHHGYQFEAQYLYHGERFNSVIGGGSYQLNNNFLFNVFIPQINRFIPAINDKDYEHNQNFGYIYTHIDLLKNIVATIGLSYDNYFDDLENANFTISQLSPKLGLQWQVNSALTLRIAGFQTVKSPIVVNQLLQPMQIAGFNQFFDDPNGTRTTQYGVGLDAHPINNFYIGAEAYKRDLNVPSIHTEIKSVVFSKQEQALYRVYFNWLPYANWQFNSEMRFESFRGPKQLADYQSVDSAYIPLNVRYFNKIGFFADVTGQFVHQSVLSSDQNVDSFNSNFILLDAAVGYRFPKQYGMISLEAKNLLDKNFKYRDRSYQMNEYRASDLIPERLLFARLTLNF
jgi:Tfp pilus assembly protein PilF